MSSESEIANLAATRIGSPAGITSLDDNRPVPSALKAVWNIQRRATIRDGAWNFAMRRTGLGALSTASLDGGVVPYPWTYAYQMPADALRLVEVLTYAARDNYQLEGGIILTDTAAPLYIRYMVDVTEPANWDEDFAEAFAARLAWKIGRKIAGSDFNTKEAWQEYQMAITRAKGADAKENPPVEEDEVPWVEARFSYPGTY